jgi:hypothetical protein
MLLIENQKELEMLEEEEDELKIPSGKTGPSDCHDAAAA